MSVWYDLLDQEPAERENEGAKGGNGVLSAVNRSGSRTGDNAGADCDRLIFTGWRNVADDRPALPIMQK